MTRPIVEYVSTLADLPDGCQFCDDPITRSCPVYMIRDGQTGRYLGAAHIDCAENQTAQAIQRSGRKPVVPPPSRPNPLPEQAQTILLTSLSGDWYYRIPTNLAWKCVCMTCGNTIRPGHSVFQVRDGRWPDKVSGYLCECCGVHLLDVCEPPNPPLIWPGEEDEEEDDEEEFHRNGVR